MMRTLQVARRLLCLLLVCGLVARAQENRGSLQVSKDNRSIAITATEHVLNEADTGIVHIGFLLYGPDKDTVYATGTRASNAITDALRSAGVAKEQIQSESQSVSPTDPNELERLGKNKADHAFTVSQSWTVQANAADAARILDLAIRAGANQSGQIDWSLHDPSAAESAAATKAIQRARTQAAAMAAGLGVHLGQLLYASNEVNAGILRAPMKMLERRERSVDSAQPLSLRPQQIETSATVYAVFALE